MHATRYGSQPRQAIIARQRTTAKLKKAARHNHIKNNITIAALILCCIGVAWVDGGL